MNFFKPWKLRLQQAFIVLAHLALLKWIYYALYQLGASDMLTVLYHFAGMSAFGASLIYGTAMWAKRKYLKENNLTHLPK